MKRSIFFTISLFFIFFSNHAQITNEGRPKSWEVPDMKPISSIYLPLFDFKSIQEEDQVNDKLVEIPYRFGYKFDVNYNLQNSGNWETLSNGDRIWRIRFTSKGALTMNFILEDFFIPIGAKLFLYNNDKTDVLGAYTFIQNNKNRTLGTWIVKGDDVILEYFEPAPQAGKGSFTIKNITHGYRSGGSLNASSDCNIDVNCSIGNDADPLKNFLKKSVGLVLVNGDAMCSGALINNTSNDKKPYFLTANHCYSDPATWSFRFNWISTNTVCGTGEDSISNTDYHTISGATLKAKRATADFCLVEINSKIPEDWETVLSGWDRTNIVPQWVFGIHHPAGDIMKTCRDNDPIVSGEMWQITNWDLGHAESGSSGSPLFNNSGRIIGQLCCGNTSCDQNINSTGNYSYGRLASSWDGSATSDTQLKYWLDPTSSGALALDSYPLFTMGVSENLTADEIRVYPNPSKDVFTINLKNINSDISFELTSATGNLVHKGIFSRINNKVDLTNSSNGIYFLKLSKDKIVIKTIKLLKQ